MSIYQDNNEMNSSFINRFECLLRNISAEDNDTTKTNIDEVNSCNDVNTSNELSFDFKELPEDIFISSETEATEIKADSNSELGCSMSSFQRQNNSNKPQTMKINNTLLHKEQQVNDEQYLLHVNEINRAKRKHAKTQLIKENDINGVLINNPSLHSFINPCNDLSMFINQLPPQQQVMCRNNHIKKTYIHQMSNSSFNNQMLQQTSLPQRNENKRFNTSSHLNLPFNYESNSHSLNNTPFLFCQQQQQQQQLPNQQMQFQLTLQFNETKKFEMEMFLEELEHELKNANSINANIFYNIKHRFIPILKTQAGSRLLQNFLPQTKPEIISLIYKELSDKITLLLPDSYANYFCVKLFTYLTPNERLSFLNIITKHIVSLSTNKIATCPIQCIISNIISRKEKEVFMKAVNKVIKKLAFDVYGAHVLEKIVICFERELSLTIISFVIEHFILLANHANGLCLAKKILINEYKSENFLYLKTLLKEQCLSLIENPFGNYALQVVIESWNETDLDEVFNQILKYASQLSTMKYSSNVIEKCIAKSEMFLQMYIERIVKDIRVLIRSNYGNYVIQTAVKFSKGNYKYMLINAIEMNIDCLGERKLINKWKNIIVSNLQEYSNYNMHNPTSNYFI